MECHLKIELTDYRFCKMTILSTELIDFTTTNEICIKNVPHTISDLKINGQFSKDLGPGLCFIKYENWEWETYGIGQNKYKGLYISSNIKRTSFVYDDINIKIKIWFPKHWDFESKNKIKNIDFEILNGVSELPTHYVHCGGIDETD